MYLLGLGLILLVLKWQAIGPVANWSWWWIAAPFLAAFAWWEWADWSGYTKRQALRRAERKRQARAQRRREMMLGREPRR